MKTCGRRISDGGPGGSLSVTDIHRNSVSDDENLLWSFLRIFNYQNKLAPFLPFFFLGTALAAGAFLWVRSGIGPYCAKLHHANDKRCIFRHGTQPKHIASAPAYR